MVHRVFLQHNSILIISHEKACAIWCLIRRIAVTLWKGNGLCSAAVFELKTWSREGILSVYADEGTYSYPSAATPGLDQRTPGTVDAYIPTPHVSAQTPGGGMTPAFADSSMHTDITKARRYLNLLVTVPSKGNATALVQAVDMDGRLLVGLGSFQSSKTSLSTNGTTFNLVSIRLLGPCSWRTGCRIAGHSVSLVEYL